MDFSGISFEDLVMSKRTIEVQLVLLLLQTVVVKIAFDFIRKVTKQYIDKQSWKTQFIALSKTTYKAMGISLNSEEDWYDASVSSISFSIHHLIGGLLCVPSVLGVPGISPQLSFALARHGALFEAAFELSDVLTRAYQILFTSDGWSKNPRSVLTILAIHHTCGLSSVVPMNLFFGDSRLYHEAVFLLQGAAGIALGAQAYGYTINIKTNTGIFQMKLLTSLVMAVMLYTRVFRYCLLGFELAQMMYNGNFAVFTISMFACLAMSLFNVIIVGDAFKKFKKFAFMEYISKEDSKLKMK